MLTSQEVKAFIAENCGSQVIGIASAAPFRDEDKKRIVATLKILKSANPAMDNEYVFDPEDFVDGAKSVISFGINNFFGIYPSADSTDNNGPRGAIGNFYLNENVLNKAMSYFALVKEYLGSQGFKSETPFAGFPQKIKALEAGLGFHGKNTLVIDTKLGSWFSLATVITDAALEPDEPAQGGCGTCRHCIEACPTGALTTPYTTQVDKCIIYYLCHWKKEIPLAVRDQIGVRIGNCTVCSDVCPHNKNLMVNAEDKLPDDVIYPHLIPLMNMTDDEYEEKYGAKMFGFIIGGRQYLRRNIAVALGNSGCREALPSLETAARDEDPLVRSHAAWAIEKLKGRL